MATDRRPEHDRLRETFSRLPGAGSKEQAGDVGPGWRGLPDEGEHVSRTVKLAKAAWLAVSVGIFVAVQLGLGVGWMESVLGLLVALGSGAGGWRWIDRLESHETRRPSGGRAGSEWDAPGVRDAFRHGPRGY